MQADFKDLTEEEYTPSLRVSHIRRELGDLYVVLHTAGRLNEFCFQRLRFTAVKAVRIEELHDESEGINRTLIVEALDAATVSHTTSEARRDLKLSEIPEHIEGVLDLVTKQTRLSINQIQQLHQVITSNQEYFEGKDSLGNVKERDFRQKGVWRKALSSPEDDDSNKYVPYEHVQSAMDQLLRDHGRHEEENVPSEISAAWMHHCFTKIHPFQDGNGRMARVLASILLLQDRLYPLKVPGEDREQYITKLRQADAGDLQPLIDYFSSLQAREHLLSLKILRDMPEGRKLDNALAEKRKERLASAESSK